MGDACLERALVGDVGGTNARFAVVALDDGALTLEAPRTFRCRDYASLQDVIAAYLADRSDASPACVSVAVAGPVLEGVATMTNLPWSISEAGLVAGGFRRAAVVNDFEALAFGLADLGPADVDAIGRTSAPPAGLTLAILGAGTGFGAAALVRRGARATVLAGEGGHISFAPVDPLEIAVLQRLTDRFGRVSVERLLSGPGLANLYDALAEIAGVAAPAATPAEITAAALAGDTLAVQAVERFCSVYGSVAGDLALSFGARGGVFLAGGIAPQLDVFLQRDGFRRAFEAKGRFQPYLAAVPTAIVTHPYLALIGAARALQA
jgi:glucokinase